uniref:Ig-like domain-containing protein n=1 Tax=uncultured Polaribacter sp. TaxID=174711 RepID=UPI002615D8DA
AEGVYTFTYTIADASNDQDTATVTVTVGTPASTLSTPTAVDDTANAVSTVISPATAPAAVTINVLANDIPGTDGYIIDGLRMPNGTFSGASAEGGLLTIDTNSTTLTTDDRFIYTPPANFVGTDTFDYTITDGTGDAATGTVTITVTDGSAVVNDPTAVDDTASVAVDATVSIAVLDNDTAGTEGYATPAIV